MFSLLLVFLLGDKFRNKTEPNLFTSNNMTLSVGLILKKTARLFSIQLYSSETELSTIRLVPLFDHFIGFR